MTPRTIKMNKILNEIAVVVSCILAAVYLYSVTPRNSEQQYGNPKFNTTRESERVGAIKEPRKGALDFALKSCCVENVYCTKKPFQYEKNSDKQVVSIRGDIKDIIKAVRCTETVLK